jgi:putative ABC transport system permease protein
VTLFVRGSAPPATLVPALQRVLRGIDPHLPFFDVRPMTERLDEQTATGRFLVRLMATFALLGLVLAGVGVYGVIAYTVTQRTRELGVRIALGATRGDILRHVMRGALLPVGAGLLAGGLGVWALGRAVAGLLYGIPAADPLALAITTVVLLALALAASWLPARRAAAIEPVIALRGD